MRQLSLAIHFLTRLPLTQQAWRNEESLADSAGWFAVVGLLIGTLLATIAILLASAWPWLTALLITLTWIAISGGLHLDGAADLADGLGAAHRDPQRLLAVMKEPHIGSFGVITLISIILTKVVSLAALLQSHAPATLLWALLLTPAWARLAAAWWAATVPPLGDGFAADLASNIHPDHLIYGMVALGVISLLLMPWTWLLATILTLMIWQGFLQYRIGGMNGDCLGAGIEFCECALLLAALATA
ncbi:MAG: adenosylcobinamide-GDP ribazoletransferase [Mariprofundales bacterium]